MRYAQRAMRKFIPVMKNDKLNLWRAVYAERCKYGFRREYGAVEVGDRLCLPHEKNPSCPEHLKTVRGIGYQWRE